MLKMTAKSLYRVLRSHWLNSFILSWLFVILPADMLLFFWWKVFLCFIIYICICLQIYILLGLCSLVGIGYRSCGIWVYTKRSRRLDCANRYIVRDIVVLSHDLVQADVLYYLWIWPFFYTVCSDSWANQLFLQNQPFLVKIVQKIISCEWFSLAV